MKRALGVLLLFMVVLCSGPALSASRQVRATASPPTAGSACNVTYDDALLIDISNGDQYYCSSSLWVKRASGVPEWVTRGVDEDSNGTNPALEYDATNDTLYATPDADGVPNFKWTGGAVPKFYIGSNLSSSYSYVTETAFFGSTGFGISSNMEQLYLADADSSEAGGAALGTDRRFAFMSSAANAGYEFDIDGSLDRVSINPDGDASIDFTFCTDESGADGEALILTSGCIGYGAAGSGDMTAAVYDSDSDGEVNEAEALAANGTNCSTGEAALGVDEAGNAEGCWTPSGSGDMTKTVYDSDDDGEVNEAEALAANGTNCSAGEAALGVDEDGNAEGCWTPTGSSAGDFVTVGVDSDGTGAGDPEVEADPLLDRTYIRPAASSLTEVTFGPDWIGFEPTEGAGIIFDAVNETGLFTWKLCSANLTFFYDALADGDYDTGTDYCWGVGGYDSDCDCTADAATVTITDDDVPDTITIDAATWAKSGIDAGGDGANAEVSIDTTADTVSLNPASDASPAWVFCEDAPAADEVAYYDSAAGCWKAKDVMQLSKAKPYQYVELWDDFLKPSSGPDVYTSELFVSSDASGTQFYQFNNNARNVDWSEDFYGTNTAENGIGWAYINTGTATSNKGIAGFTAKNSNSEPSSLWEFVFQMKKARHFRTRVKTNFTDTNENGSALVGGIGRSKVDSIYVGPSASTRETGAYFICQPDLDLDDDGTAGDADDDNWWAVVDLNLDDGGDTVCMINGPGTCTPSANRTAANTEYECSGSTAIMDYIATLEIEHDGAGSWVFRLDNDNDDSTWDWTSGTTFDGLTMEDYHGITMWGIAISNQGNGTGTNKAVYLDYLYYYGVRN